MDCAGTSHPKSGWGRKVISHQLSEVLGLVTGHWLLITGNERR